MSAPPYMRLYWGDYSRKTRHLTRAAEHGAYLMLIGALWDNDGKLPADDSTLAAYALCTPEEWTALKPKIMPLLTVSRGKVSQARVTEELAKYKSTSGKRKEAGKKGGSASHGKYSENGQAIAEQLPTQSESKSESKVEEEANASSVVSTTTKARKRIEYPIGFEEAWAAYPHTDGRSSKPNSLDRWRRLSPDEQAGLVRAIAAFRPNVAKVCGDRGAPCMSRWLKDGKHLNWTGASTATTSAPVARFTGPAELRDRILALTDAEFVESYIDPAGWDAATRSLIARTGFGAKAIERRLRAYLAEKKITVAVVGQTPTAPEFGLEPATLLQGAEA